VFWLCQQSFCVISEPNFRSIEENEIFIWLIFEFVKLPEIKYSELHLYLVIH
jgi:hypothetical protein